MRQASERCGGGDACLAHLCKKLQVLCNGGRLGAAVAAQVQRHELLVVLVLWLPAVKQHIPVRALEARAIATMSACPSLHCHEAAAGLEQPVTAQNVTIMIG